MQELLRRILAFNSQFQSGTHSRVGCLRASGGAIFIGLALALVVGLSGCKTESKTPTLWIYTSLYPHVIQDLERKLVARFPGVKFRWYQSGSENVAAKVNSELLAGQTQADLILTSDPFWYEDLKLRKKLLPYTSPSAKAVPAVLKDPDGYYATARVPLMVIAYHHESFPESEAPRGFSDLLQPKFKNKVAMGNPLESGTSFTTVALLTQKFGWDYVAKLRAQGLLSAGGNSSVLARIETKERPVGIVLLENVLATRRRNPKIQIVYPIEGALLIPSPVAILATTRSPELARQAVDFFFSPEGQESIVKKGDMHSPIPGVASPEGARTWDQIFSGAMQWSPALFQEIFKNREEIKKKFSQMVLE